MTLLIKSLRSLNWHVIFNVIGYALIAEGALMMLPVICAVIYGEWHFLQAFVLTALAALVLGSLLSRIKVKTNAYFAKDGLISVGLVWIVISLVGAVPFCISGAIPSFTDSFFETVSGFTTTGSTILTNVESLPRSMLFWRSFTHWIGGMGVLVFILAFLPKANEHSMHIMRAESPGPSISKLVPHIKQTAMILYGLYFGLSVLETIFLLAGGMPVFDTLITMFGTAGTGGFSNLAQSIGQYDSVYIEMVVMIFIFLFGINFSLYFFLLIKKYTSFFKNEELKVYVGIVLSATVLIALNIYPAYKSWADAFRLAGFQVVSVITTTGYATADFNLWPMFSKGILLLLMVCGAMAGSTGGGVKVSRIMIVIKQIKLNIQKLVHPQKVDAITLESKLVDPEIVSQTMSFFSTWMVLIGAGILLVALDNFDFETTLSAVFTCIGNVGPGFGLCGPMGSFAAFSNMSKIVLSFLMLIGRLEIYPILIFLFPFIAAMDHKPRFKNKDF